MKKYLILLFFIFFSCNDKNNAIKEEENTPKQGGDLIIGISNDFDFLNPVLSTDLVCESVQDLIFPSLLDIQWDNQKDEFIYNPYLATRWEETNNGKSILFNLKTNSYWEDGKIVNAEDILFSYQLYSNPLVPSPKRISLLNFLPIREGKTFSTGGIEIINDSIMRFNFKRNYFNKFIHSNLKIIAKHVFEKSDLKNIMNDTNNFKPLGSGPYKLSEWKENQFVILSRNDKFNLSAKPNINKIIFKILPEPVTKLAALKQGEIDFCEGIRPDDINSIKSTNNNIKFIDLNGRYYDYISWSNIDNAYYKKTGKIKPNMLFGDKRVRKALTMCINRMDIIRGIMNGYAKECTGPISPVFRWAVNENIKPIPYEPESAKKLLQEAGWVDSDGDGIIERDGVKFKFTLFYPTGNLRREFAANIAMNNLKKIGINVSVEKMEWNIFTEKIDKREIDAFLSGNGISYTFDFKNFWGSNLNESKFNDPGFQNKRIDELLELADNVNSLKDSAPYWKEFQDIIQDEQPCTFLYWYSMIIGYNDKIKNVKSNIWDSYNRIWEWWIKN